MLENLPYNYVCIEGNIGAGKTSLVKRIASEYQAQIILEEFADNPFLPYFYKDPTRYAFTVELFFMTERHKQLQQHLINRDLFYKFIVSDYFFPKTLIFARKNLKEDEYRLFNRLFNILNANFPKPDILIYLHRSPTKLRKNIRSRGREYEYFIGLDYLQNIQDSYFEYFRSVVQFPILVIDVEEMDFLTNDDQYNEIKRLISRSYNPGLHRVRLT